MFLDHPPRRRVAFLCVCDSNSYILLKAKV